MELLVLNHKHSQAYIVNINGIYIMVDSGYPESLNTFKKLLENNIKEIYPGHGEKYIIE